MELLIYIIVSGMAVSYLIEFISSFSSEIISTRLLKQILTIPLSYISCWFFDIDGFALVISGLATSFVALLLLLIANKLSDPVTVVRRPF
jgi:hypothetical protein